MLLGLLGIVVTNPNTLIGSDCSPITIIGVGGGVCSANIVCCQNNNFVSTLSLRVANETH